MGSLIYLLLGTSVLTASIQPPSSPQSTLSPPSLFLARVRNLLFSSYATHSILVVVYTSEGRLLLQNISPLAKSRSQAYHNDVLHPTLLAMSPQDRPAIHRTHKIKIDPLPRRSPLIFGIWVMGIASWISIDPKISKDFSSYVSFL